MLLCLCRPRDGGASQNPIPIGASPRATINWLELSGRGLLGRRSARSRQSRIHPSPQLQLNCRFAFHSRRDIIASEAAKPQGWAEERARRPGEKAVYRGRSPVRPLLAPPLKPHVELAGLGWRSPAPETQAAEPAAECCQWPAARQLAESVAQYCRSAGARAFRVPEQAVAHCWL